MNPEKPNQLTSEEIAKIEEGRVLADQEMDVFSAKKSFNKKNLFWIIPLTVIVGLTTKNYVGSAIALILLTYLSIGKMPKKAEFGINIRNGHIVGLGLHIGQISDIGIHLPIPIKSIGRVYKEKFVWGGNISIEIHDTDGKNRTLRVALRPYSKETISSFLHQLQAENPSIRFEGGLKKDYDIK